MDIRYKMLGQWITSTKCCVFTNHSSLVSSACQCGEHQKHQNLKSQNTTALARSSMLTNCIVSLLSFQFCTVSRQYAKFQFSSTKYYFLVPMVSIANPIFQLSHESKHRNRNTQSSFQSVRFCLPLNVVRLSDSPKMSKNLSLGIRTSLQNVRHTHEYSFRHITLSQNGYCVCRR